MILHDHHPGSAVLRDEDRFAAVDSLINDVLGVCLQVGDWSDAGSAHGA